MAPFRVLIVPLAAACAAALFAHVGIDVAGDFLLPHDAYDDVAHGSRMTILGVVATLLALFAACALSAAVREARGCVHAFARTVRSSLDLGLAKTLALTAGCATLALVAMECADLRSAGLPIDDLGDLFGGSFVLGALAIVFAACVCSIGSRALVRAIAGAGRGLVRALAIAFFPHVPCISAIRVVVSRPERACARALRFATSISGRAPPRSRSFRALSIF